VGRGLPSGTGQEGRLRIPGGNATCEGRELNLERPRPYRDYIEWLQQQDMVEAELFWRDLLKGFTAPTPLIGDAQPVGRSDADENIEIQKVWLSQATTEKLQAWARRLGVTLNTLVLGAWAILLSRYSDEPDIVISNPAASLELLNNRLPMRNASGSIGPEGGTPTAQ